MRRSGAVVQVSGLLRAVDVLIVGNRSASGDNPNIIRPDQLVTFGWGSSGFSNLRLAIEETQIADTLSHLEVWNITKP